MLIGRDPEQRLIESLLEDAHGGASAALVIRGEAGIGKTAALEYAADRCGWRRLRCTGVESEHDLTFAGLEQLLRPVRDLVGRLPEPQASALRSALGMSAERVEDRLLLGLATWNAFDLEDAANASGLPMCVVRTPAEWLAHEQGALLAALAGQGDQHGLREPVPYDAPTPLGDVHMLAPRCFSRIPRRPGPIRFWSLVDPVARSGDPRRLDREAGTSSVSPSDKPGNPREVRRPSQFSRRQLESQAVGRRAAVDARDGGSQVGPAIGCAAARIYE